MTSSERLAELDAMKFEFEHPDTSDARRMELLTTVRTWAAEEMPEVRPCLSCKHIPFYAPWEEALIPGHVYSGAGVDELKISGFCEYCFDEVTAER